MHWYWLVCGILMILMELGMRRGLIVFFGISAMISGAAVYFYPAVVLRWQMVIFVTAGVALCGAWQLLKKLLKSKNKKS